eukprot:TRINITY_DN3929_c0_g1_i1.p3 TRINITY_DN3929_c0_g1~~TRINITY_DN3929_c0_g1_i1.p3  ORF type:complete len:266 (+),score=24.93 TRINITY_DN3929_c0_g1_i1:1134-1931(+)
MGIHWRRISTEAPWATGRNERHHGPIRDAFRCAMAETPALSPDLDLAMRCKAGNDSPRAHGVVPTTGVTGDLSRLIIGDNHHADRFIAARATAMQTARNTMKRYTATDHLRGALSHPGINVPFVFVGQEVLFHWQRHGWLRGTVHSLSGNTVYVRHDRFLFSFQAARTEPYVAHLLPSAMPRPVPARRPDATPPARLAPPSPGPHPTDAAWLDLIRSHAPASAPPPTLDPSARAFLAPTTNPDSPNHHRWDVSKQTEIFVFISFD